MDILGPDHFGHFTLQYRGLSLSEVKNVLVTPVGIAIFVLMHYYGGFFYCVLNAEDLLKELGSTVYAKQKRLAV